MTTKKQEKSISINENDIANVFKLNNEQKLAFDLILNVVYQNEDVCFFVDGPGGTGKTFLYKTLLPEIRSKGFIALATTTSGIATSILPGGRTAHLRFKIPIDATDDSTCQISKQSALAGLIKDAKLIIWDEAPMANKTIIQTFNSLLKDIIDNDKIFGGKVVVFGGDFRQTLPVVPKGAKQDLIRAILLSLDFWPALQKIKLTENMRAKEDPFFANLLLRIGDGTANIDSFGNVNLP